LTIEIAFSNKEMKDIQAMKIFIECAINKELNYKDTILVLCRAGRDHLSGFNVIDAYNELVEE
jgi:hypothetical protein